MGITDDERLVVDEVAISELESLACSLYSCRKEDR